MTARLTRRWLVPLCGTIVTFLAPSLRAADDAASVFRLIPAEVPFAAVFVNLDRFDKSVSAFAKRVAPDGAYAGMLDEIREDLGIGEWVDFTRPFGMAQTDIAGGGRPIAWVRVSDFTKKVKELKNATEEGGVWHVERDDQSEFYLKQAGDYVIVTGSRASLDAATVTGKSMRDVLGGRLASYEGREVILHINFESIRPILLAQVAQLSQMAPMFAAMMGPQAGMTGPAAMGNVFTAVFDGLKSFLEQVEYLEVAGSLDDKNADVTIATGYKDGPIRNYLDQCKPATVVAFDQLEEQPFLVAASYHFPGDQSPFMDYLLEKALGASNPAGEAAGKADAASANKMARDLYRTLEGQNMVMNMTPDGLRVTGDYIGKDAPAILRLQKEVMTAPNALTAAFNAGVKYESGPTRKVESTEIHTLSMKWDPASPVAASSTKMYPKDACLALGVVGERVRFAMASEKDIDKAFSAKATRPLSGSPRVSEALASLPARRNAVILFDPAGVMPILAALSGGSMEAAGGPPGPPIALSASFAGEPARVDLRVPLRAIERLVQQLSPKQPT